MARRSLRSSAASASSPASRGESRHKRAPSGEVGLQEPKRRKSRDARPSPKSTPKKSRHFGKSMDDEHESDLTSDNESMTEQDASAYEDSDANAAASPSGSEALVSEASEAEVKPKKSSGKKGPTVSLAKGAKGQELWRPGVKANLGPGREIIIKRPKAREAGKTPYTDDSIHPNTMLFLKDLAANNDREWLKSETAHFSYACNLALLREYAAPKWPRYYRSKTRHVSVI